MLRPGSARVGRIRIVHRPSGTVIAEGPRGWGICPWAGGLYVARRHLRTDGFADAGRGGLCPMKGLFRWLDLTPPAGAAAPALGWRYWLPNPLMPFIWLRVAVPDVHPDVAIEEV